MAPFQFRTQCVPNWKIYTTKHPHKKPISREGQSKDWNSRFGLFIAIDKKNTRHAEQRQFYRNINNISRATLFSRKRARGNGENGPTAAHGVPPNHTMCHARYAQGGVPYTNDGSRFESMLKSSGIFGWTHFRFANRILKLLTLSRGGCVRRLLREPLGPTGWWISMAFAVKSQVTK